MLFTWLIRAGFALLALVLVSALALWSWGRFAAGARGEATHALPVAESATRLDRLVAPLLAAQPPKASGAAMIDDAVQAFVARVRTARAAERTLDVQYYIWRHDLSGNLLEHELMAAAERGVRVRLLIDDISVAGRDDIFLAMDAHPNLEVRLFNPARNRGGSFTRALEMGLRFVGFNRRMHNKAWIADNRVALVGGRNVGDEYFDAAAATNFQDADLLLLGPAVAQASEIFDAFWNSAAVVPLHALHPNGSRWSAQHYAQQRQQQAAAAAASPWVGALAARDDLDEKIAQGGLTLHWSDSIRVLSDPPEKAAALAQERDRPAWLLYDVMALLFSARGESLIISPYFVPGDGGMLLLAGQARRGVNVRVLTNSLAANDVPIVHSGYQKYRAPLLRHGVHLFELKPGSRNTDRELLGSSGASLHTKAFVVDGARGFVGSFNFDPRSAQLNTEMGVVFDHPGLAAEVARLFAQGTKPESAWRVRLADGSDSASGRNLQWQGAAGQTHTQEPETSAQLRALVWLLGWLPIESQL